ncbi:MAG: nucleoside-diphosphate kinase, partial [Candidatus Omnitrophota bacterium]
MKCTFFMVKPDAVAAGYVEEIVKYLNRFDFEVVNRKQKILTRKDVIFLCPMHISRDFFEDLVAFLSSGPSELFILKRRSATKFLNELVGRTDPKQNKGYS